MNSKHLLKNNKLGFFTYDNRMNGSDSSTSEHCDRELHDHGHVNRHAIAFVNAVHFEHICEAADFLEKLSISQATEIIRMVAFPT